MLQKLLWLATAGALGTLSRYGVAQMVQGATGGEFPWGTVAANLFGCFLVGLFWSLAQNRLSISPEVQAIVLVGFMGAFTTFSAFALDTGKLICRAQYWSAFGNIALQNILGLALIFLGLTLGRGQCLR